jgi:hypothetical protein
MTTEITTPAFDYRQLEGDDWKFVQDARDEIKRLGKQTVESICEIGRLLTEVKARLSHGQWLPWLAAEFAWSETTARRFMDSYELFKSAKLEDLPRLLELPPSAVAELAASSTPGPARREVLEQVAAGDKPTTQQVRETVHRHKVERARTSVDRLHVEPVTSITAPTIKTEPVEGRDYLLEQDRYGFKHRRPADNATVVDIEWLRTGPIEDVSDWMVNVLGRDRLDALLDALTAPEPAPDDRHMDIDEDVIGEPSLSTPEPPQPELAEEMADAMPETADTGNGAAQPRTKTITCMVEGCGTFEAPVQRGQPPKFCPEHRANRTARQKAREAAAN